MCATSNDRPPGSIASNSGFLPEGAERCVWMAAGLVAYKLCDRAFECEACSFDTVMRGQAAAAAPGDPAPLSIPAVSTTFPADRRYHPAHTWASTAGPDRLRIGLDAFAARLASHTMSVVLPPPGSCLARGRAGSWLVDESGPIPLKMPVSGPVLRQNLLLRTHPRLAVESPYEDGWLVEVGWRDLAAREMDELLTAGEMRLRADHQLEQLEAEAMAELRRGREAVGPTLPDGGERLADLRAMLGPSRYCRLVMRLLA
jgi:glycine cleavage system H protein